MSATLQICVLLLTVISYIEAMKTDHSLRRTTSGMKHTKNNDTKKSEQSYSHINDDETPSKKLKSNPSKAQQSNHKKAEPKKAEAKTFDIFELPSTPIIEEQVVPRRSLEDSSMGDGTEMDSNADSMVPEHAHAENVTDEAVSMEEETAIAMPMDPKSQRDELLEMNDVFQWEMATRSEDQQVLDPDDELANFTELIFQKLESYLQNEPSPKENEKVNGQLAEMVEQWKQPVQPIDVDPQIVHIFEVQNSLNELDEQLTEQNMSGIKATPAILDVVLDSLQQNYTLEEEKVEFLWKVINRKPTRYVKNVGQFLGGISIGIKYLEQVANVGQWALKNSFITNEQFANLNNVLRENVAKLSSILQEVVSKMGINLKKIGINKLLAKKMPSLDKVFTQNLDKNLAIISETAKIEQVEFNENQIGTLLLLNALNIANKEVELLEDEILGIQLTWPLFQAVGEVSNAAQLLKQIQI